MKGDDDHDDSCKDGHDAPHLSRIGHRQKDAKYIKGQQGDYQMTNGFKHHLFKLYGNVP